MGELKEKYRYWNGKKMIDLRATTIFAVGASGLEGGIYIPDFDNVDRWIGAQDIDKIDIYTGDVIRGNLIDYSLETLGVVEYSLEHYSYCNKNDGGLTALSSINRIKIIGNIYENPEYAELCTEVIKSGEKNV